MLKTIEKIENVLGKIERVIFVVLLAFMAIVMFAAVVARYVLNSPLTWSEELLTVLQGALAFAGIGYCFQYKAHTRVLLLHDKLPKFVQGIIDLFCDGVMIYCLYKLLNTMPKYMKSKSAPLTSLRFIKYSYFNWAIYAGFVIAVLYIIFDALRTIMKMAGRYEENDQAKA